MVLDIVEEYEINVNDVSVSHLYSCMDGSTFHWDKGHWKWTGFEKGKRNYRLIFDEIGLWETQVDMWDRKLI